jgi:beta-galactosidase/beta-glucuronidase
MDRTLKSKLFRINKYKPKFQFLNMKRIIFFAGVISLSLTASAQWKPAGDLIKTEWANKVDPNKVLPEYPRPLMERQDWLNLNGLWDYAILPAGQPEPAKFDGKILVPFAIESSLSGVQKTVGDKNELWYNRTFTVPAAWKGKNVLLHFGAVDWKTEVFVNDVKIGAHTGGYTPFCFDVTPFLTGAGQQKLVVKVWDGTDTGFQPRGKQVTDPKGIWYTAVTGIWQTVWLEPVNEKYIANVKSVPNIDNNRLSVDVCTKNTQMADIIEVKVNDGAKVVAASKAASGQTLELNIPDAKLWSPESPFLYGMEVILYSKGKVVDQVKSYCAMRKISTKRDTKGIVRMQLNNKDYFHFGPLDQGWWPDGLYTAPTDEALAYDIVKTKEFGFNMIRKHVKVEPARWYTHCDRLGILVWQDMPSGDRSPQWQMFKYFDGSELKRSSESEANFRKEWKEIMDLTFSNPSVVVWVPFNEAWGQFKTHEIAEWTKTYDPSRLVNPASGGNHYRTGDILDLHKYPAPELYLYDAERVTVLGEYGGIGLPLEGHLWQTDRNWGYVQFKNAKEVTDEYVKFAEILKNLIKAGFSAAVYTQTTDVEGEVNGLMTYDRKVVKLEEERSEEHTSELSHMAISRMPSSA